MKLIQPARMKWFAQSVRRSTKRSNFMKDIDGFERYDGFEERIEELEAENLKLRITIRDLKNQIYRQNNRSFHDEHEYNVDNGENHDR